MVLSMITSKDDEGGIPPGASDEKRGCSGVSYLNLAEKFVYLVEIFFATFSVQKISLAVQD